MHLLRRARRALPVALVVALLALAFPAQAVVGAAAEDDASDIVLVLDFSGSILNDEATRNAFADALDGIAARVAETSDTLVQGDATVSIVIFATDAADLPDCTGLALRENPDAVAQLAACLQNVAASYREGGDQQLTNLIGDDTNYVAAMEQAANHLPEDSARPALIFFTDGRHEADGVPVSEVGPARDRLFGDRTPFGLLPVGMGVDPADRARLEAGLVDLRITRDLERCEGGALDWPNVVFETAEAAGQAVALALQDVSCTFTVEPTPTPIPTPTPAPTEPPAPVRNIRLEPGDSSIAVSWLVPADAAERPVEDYLVRCVPSSGGDAIVSAEGVSTEPSATVEGLANGTEYACEVAVVRGGVAGEWTAAGGPVTPFGRPPAPPKPTVEALNGAVRIGLTAPAGGRVDGYGFQCSFDGGSTWPVTREAGGAQPVVDITGLANGTTYVCRASASNDRGVSDFSPVSDPVRPCSGLLDCNPYVLPLFGVLVLLLVAALALALYRWYGRRQVYVTAQVDNYASITLGRGPSVGMAFVTRGPYRTFAGVAAAPVADADVRIRYTGGENFEVRAAGKRHKALAGRPVRVTDQQGAGHDVVLRAFDAEPQPLRRPEE